MLGGLVSLVYLDISMCHKKTFMSPTKVKKLTERFSPSAEGKLNAYTMRQLSRICR